MGGAVALKMHFKQPKAWDGAILVAPMCKVIFSFSSEKFNVGCFVRFSMIFFDQTLYLCRLQMTWFLHGC